MTVFSPIWFLEDSGIVYSNIEQALVKNKSIEIRSVGNSYTTLLKGYTGIAVIFSYYMFLISLSPHIEPENLGLLSILLIFGLLVFMPILISMSLIPTIIILDLMKTLI